MAIMISRDGKDAKRVDKATTEYESYLQNYIRDNPDILPVHEISEGTKLLVLAREFHTTSGPLDAVGIDNEGHIYIIETKLIRNPDTRYIVAQVLDYGAALWKYYENPQDFVDALEDHCGKEGLIPKIMQIFEMTEDEAASVVDEVKKNLQEGSIRFILLMDKLHDHLKDLIVFMNQNSKFDFYGVEMEFYKCDDLGLEIMIPKIFGMGVRKDIGSGGSVENPVRIMNKQIMRDACEELSNTFEKDMSYFYEKFSLYTPRSGNAAFVFMSFHHEGSEISIGAKLSHDKLEVGLYSWTKKGHKATASLYNEHLSEALPTLKKNPDDINNLFFYEVPLETRDNEPEILKLVVDEVTKFTKPVLEVLKVQSV